MKKKVPKAMAKKTKLLKRKWTISFKQLVVFIVLFAAVGTIAVLQSFAAPGSGGKGSKTTTYTGSFVLSYPITSPTTSPPTQATPKWGDKINFSVTSNAPYAYVGLDCYQSGIKVYHQDVGYFSSWIGSKYFTLTGPNWTSGAADCTPTLYSENAAGSNYQKLAAAPQFHVNP